MHVPSASGCRVILPSERGGKANHVAFIADFSFHNLHSNEGSVLAGLGSLAQGKSASMEFIGGLMNTE